MRRWIARTALLAAGLVGGAGGVTAQQLTVDGNRILRDGQPFRIRGVAVGDPVLARADRPADDYRVLAEDWHVNAVRLSIHPHVWKHEDRSRVLAILDRDVEAARGRGLVVVLTWHSIGWPDGGYQIPTWPGARRDTYDSKLGLARDFWTAMARRYGDDGGIVFELWNEPANFDAEGKVQDYPGWPALRPAMQGLLDLIRRESGNVVLASGGRWTYDLRGIAEAPLRGENVGYAWHVYAGNDGNDPNKWADKLGGLDRVAPVVVTEWGFQRGADAHYKGTPEDFGRPFHREILRGHDLGWTAWVWHPAWGPPMLEDDWRTPNEFGGFVKGVLAGE